ncbi:MAG: excalibur calcium-binding domain-containing protein [Acidimicrobiia bacterium]|nr:excalibur calcium-binding domain-containing protein [Acidimicrobiia bacterium]
MSAEPPPPDWVQSDAAFHHRRSILDGEDAGPSRSLPRVTLEAVPRVSTLGDSERSADDGIVSTVRREWEDLAFTMLRWNQLLAFVGFVLVLALAIYGWERGTLSGMAAEISAERIEGGAPAAPKLSSDQVAWDDTLGEDGGDGRRSTASFASDRALAEAVDDEPTSGAKLFVADGKKSKRAASSSAEDEPTDDAGRDASRVAATGAADGDSANRGSTTRTPVEPTTTTAVRYENCAQAAAAGAAPIQLGEPGYRLSLDRDKDGVACENGSTPEDPGDAPVDSLYSNPTTTTSGGSGSTTTASSTGAGTTSTVESTTTSRNSTTGSTTTTAKPTSSASTTTTTTSTTVTTSTASSTTTTMSTTTMSTASSTTTTTRPSTTSSTTTTSVPTTTSSTPTTVSTTDDLPPVDPLGGTQAGPA